MAKKYNVLSGPKTGKAAPKTPTGQQVWNQTRGPGSTSMGASKPFSNQAAVFDPYAGRDLAAELGQQFGMVPGGPQPPTSSSMGSMYGGGNSGGGRQGPSAAQLGAVNSAFTLDESPYWHMQAALDNQRRQAEAYNPNFAGMEQTALQSGANAEAQRAAMVQGLQGGLVQRGQQMAGQQATAMAGAARDLGGQGFNMAPYMQQANQMGADRVSALGNQDAYMTMLNANAAGAGADFQRGAATIRQGGETALGNARGQMYNQLDMQGAQIQQQAAQARLANNQAKLQFMIQNGLI